MSLTYTSIYQAINTSLGRHTNEPISPLTPLLTLGIEALDLADIFFKLHIPIQNYFSAGANKLTPNAREELADAAFNKLHQRNGEGIAFSLLKIRACKNLDDLIKNTTPVDIFHLCENYHETHDL